MKIKKIEIKSCEVIEETTGSCSVCHEEDPMCDICCDSEPQEDVFYCAGKFHLCKPHRNNLKHIGLI